MSDPLPQVSYEVMHRAMRAVIASKGGLPASVILAEFGMPTEPAQITAYNALGRRVDAFTYLYQYCKQQLEDRGLTEYQLLSAAAVAPLDYTADGWELEEFVAVASRLPPKP